MVLEVFPHSTCRGVCGGSWGILHRQQGNRYSTGPDAADSTILSMGIGGFLTSILFAALCGWRGWNFKMLLVIAFVVAGLYSANPAVGILVIPFVALAYFVTTKIKYFLSYYSSPEIAPSDEGDSEQ